MYCISYNMHPRTVYFPLSKLKKSFFLKQWLKNPFVGAFVHIKNHCVNSKTSEYTQRLYPHPQTEGKFPSFTSNKAAYTCALWTFDLYKAETCLQAVKHEPTPATKLCLGTAQEEQVLEQPKFTPGHTPIVWKYWIPVPGNVCSIHKFI